MQCPTCGHGNGEKAKFCEECGTALGSPPKPAVDEGEEPLPPALGDGRYLPQRLLGEGSRKKVYLALDDRLGREVAVAVIKTDGLDQAGRVRLAREARATARLGDHPQIVTVHDVGESRDGVPYIVSQYMPGGSLVDRLEAAPAHRLDVREALEIVRGLADALAHAHEQGIVHRDLKPANVWIASDGKPYLGDFGLAVPVDASRITSEGMVVGTVAYIAPEQALGRDPDRRADLYGLGAVLYELLTGRPPFIGDDAVAVISQHLSSQPVSPSWHNREIDPDTEALVLRLLAKNPEDRPSSAAEVARRIDELLSREVVGVSDDVPAAEVGPAGHRTDLRQAEWGRFVGRSDELKALESAFEEVRSGRGKTMMVVGEPGIGKTRLVEELSAYATMRGGQVLWGHSYEGEAGLAYLPFVEALRSYVHRQGDSLADSSSIGLAEVAALVPEVRDHIPGLATLPPLEGDAERLRLFDGIAGFLRGATIEAPIVLVLDDLHWADKPSLLLLQHLARNIADVRLLVVGTYRDVDLERTHPLSDALVNLRRQRLFERVLLRGLPRDDVKAFIAAVGGQETPDQFADLIFRETEGNPFFVSEILRHLVETEAIKRVDGQWVGTPESVAENLPEGVREVIGRRLDALSDGCNEMLSIAAAMPGGFTIELVGDVVGGDEDLMLDLLDEAIAAQVVRDRQDQAGTFEFNHALFRQTLYGELSTPRRVRMHRRILEALEARHAGSIEAHLPELAYHAYEAAVGGGAAVAAGYAQRAGAQALEQAAYEEAARYFEMALQALEFEGVPDDEQRTDTLVALARARARAGDTRGAHAAAMDAAEIARRDADALRLGRAALAYLGMQTLSGAGEPDLVMIELLDEAASALEAFPGYTERALRAEIMARLGSHVTFRDPQRARELVDGAVEILRDLDEPRRLAMALQTSTWRREMPEDERSRRLYEAIELAERAGDLELTVSIHMGLVTRALTEHDGDAVRLNAQRLGEVARSSRAPTHLAIAKQIDAEVAAIAGRFADAERILFEVLPIAKSLADPTLIANVGVGLAPIYREQGRLASLEQATERAISEAPDIPQYRAGLAQLLLENGRTDEARQHLDVLVQVGPPSDVMRPYHVSMMAEVAAGVGSREQVLEIARWLEDEQANSAVQLGFAAYHGSIERYRGLVATRLGDHDAAIGFHEAAIGDHERIGAPAWVARSKYDLACALIARDAEGDALRAGQLLAESLEAATELEMSRLQEQVLSARLALQGVGAGVSTTASIDAVSASVTVDRPDLGAHAGRDGTVTICFSDIVDYTRMTERLGDARVHQILRSHNELLRRELLVHGGVEVKSEGDGFMLAFSDATSAVAFASAFRRAVAEHGWPPDAAGLQIRLGLHSGEVIRDADDFYGRTVIIGARVAALAGAQEILITDAVRRQVPEVRFGETRDLELKGLSGTFRVWPLLS